MKSVFDGDYLKNLSVVYAEPALKQEARTEAADMSFKRVLAEIDAVGSEEDKALKDKNFLPESLSKHTGSEWSSEDYLTNLGKKIDQSSLRAFGLTEKSIVSHQSSGQAAGTAAPSGPSEGKAVVKEPIASVNAPASQDEAINRAPIIRTAQIMRSSSSPAPQYDRASIEEIISRAGNYHGIDTNLSLAVAEAESSFRIKAVSQDGHETKGLFQLMDSTGKEMLARLGLKHDYDPFNPQLNAHLGIGYLKHLQDLLQEPTLLNNGLRLSPVKNSDDLEKLALASFNAGIGRVARAQKKAEKAGLDPTSWDDVRNFVPEITKRYVDRVTSRREILAQTRSDQFVG